MSDIERLADGIAASGVQRVFGITGSGQTLSLLDGLARRGVAYSNVFFEGSAAIMAGVTGRLTGHVGIALGIKGPGLANMVPGLAAAYLEAWPLVAITEAYAPSVDPSKAHKRIDHDRIVGGVTKGRRYLASDSPPFEQIAAWARAESPGPVLLELAGPGIVGQAPIPAGSVACHNSDAVLRLVERARRPIIIAGTLAGRSGWQTRLNDLRIPCFATAAAKGVIDETLDHAAGVYSGVGLALTPEAHLFNEADLVVGMGLRTNEVLGLRDWGCPVVNVDPLGAAASPGFDFAATSDDPNRVLDALQVKSWGRDVLASILTTLRARMASDGFQPANAFMALYNRFSGAARLVLDTGYFCTIGEHAWVAQRDTWCLGSGQGRYMGIGLPTAIGASLSDPTVPTIAVAGDGGIGMFVAELRLAVKERLPLLIVLMSDGGFGSVRTRAVAEGLVQKPMLIADPSWVVIMEAMGLPARRVENESDLETALASWNPGDGPAFVEIGFEPEQYQSMVLGIR